MVDLRKLRHAVMVAREGGYGAAADALNLSQPALSRSIQSLEADYDIQLFDRGRNGTRLTLEGSRFITVAEDMLRRTQAMDEQLRDRVASEPPTASFGMGPTSAAIFLEGIVPGLVARGMRVNVHVDSCSALQLLLRHGEIDFFVSGVAPASGFYAAHRFRVDPLPAPDVSLMVRAGHPLLVGPHTPERIAEFPVVSGSFFRDTLPPQELARLGVQAPCCVIDDYSVLARIANATDFIVVGTDLFASERPDLGLVSLNLYIESATQWALVSRSEDELAPHVRRTIASLKEHIVRTASRRSAGRPFETKPQVRAPAVDSTITQFPIN